MILIVNNVGKKDTDEFETTVIENYIKICSIKILLN